MASPENVPSPLAEALARVGDRWTLLVVEALLAGPRRFNDLLGQVPGIAPNILSERLKRLEREALLVPRPYSERPPRAAYELTAEGRDLAGALRLLAQWGAGHTDPAHAPASRVRHRDRGPLVLPDLRPSLGRGASITPKRIWVAGPLPGRAQGGPGPAGLRRGAHRPAAAHIDQLCAPRRIGI